WLLDQVIPGNPAYVMAFSYRLKGSLDLRALENSFNEIIERHEGLRTTFAVQGDEPLQFIHSKCKIRVHLTRLDHLPLAERENQLLVLAREAATDSFDLSRLPLIRVSLFKLHDAEHVLLLMLHHIVADGLSIGVMLGELDLVYRGHAGTGPGYLSNLNLQY